MSSDRKASGRLTTDGWKSAQRFPSLAVRDAAALSANDVFAATTALVDALDRHGLAGAVDLTITLAGGGEIRISASSAAHTTPGRIGGKAP